MANCNLNPTSRYCHYCGLPLSENQLKWCSEPCSEKGKQRNRRARNAGFADHKAKKEFQSAKRAAVTNSGPLTKRNVLNSIGKTSKRGFQEKPLPPATGSVLPLETKKYQVVQVGAFPSVPPNVAKIRTRRVSL
jgi:hypothetical protein